MNAPISIHPAGGPDPRDPCSQGKMEGVARHVSADGCQLVLAGKAPGVGQRFSLAAGRDPTISGTIQWVLGSRVGFAFDRPLDAATALGLSAHLAQFRTLELCALPALSSPG